MQVFTEQGKFLREFFVAPETLDRGSSGGGLHRVHTVATDMKTAFLEGRLLSKCHSEMSLWLRPVKADRMPPDLRHAHIPLPVVRTGPALSERILCPG